MTDDADRPVKAVSVPMGSGGLSSSMGVAAPIGAVSRKDRERAARTALRRESASRVVLVTALPGSVSLQRRRVDGSWETVRTRRASRLGRTRLDLPADGGAGRHRVVLSPRNENLTAWISETIG